MINDYIQQNYYNLKKQLRNIAKGADQSTYEDLYHHCLMIFMQNKKSRMAILDNKAQYFLARIMLNQWRSTTSDFKKYSNKHTTLEYCNKEVEEYNIEDDYLIELVLSALDEMIKMDDKNSFRAYMIIYYYTSNENFNEVSRKYNIKAGNARYSYLMGMEQLKKIIKKNDLFRIYNTGDYVGGDIIIKALSKSDRFFRKER